MTSDQLVNAMQGIFFYAESGCTKNVIYFVKRTIGDYSLIMLFGSFVSIKRR